MKKILLLITVLVIGAGIYLTVQQPSETGLSSFFYQFPCAQPLAVKIGDVDPNYKLSNSKVQTDINQALQIWNKAYGKQLLVYDPNSQLPINFVYDDRQKLIDQTASSTNQVQNLSNDLKQKDAQLAAQKKALDDQYTKLQQDSENFQNDYNDYKQAVDDWNSNGGSSQDDYNKLVDQQNQLKSRSDALNKQVQQYQDAAKEYNSQIDPFNKQIQQLKGDGQKLQQVAENLSDAISQNPEEGEYSFTPEGKKIDIFFIDNQDKLIETLAHEMGHALGLEHNQNSKSIMYPYIQGSLVPSSTDLAELAEICRPKSYPEIIAQRFANTFIYYQQVFESYLSKS